jgi:hypothetical protein
MMLECHPPDEVFSYFACVSGACMAKPDFATLSARFGLTCWSGLEPYPLIQPTIDIDDGTAGVS